MTVLRRVGPFALAFGLFPFVVESAEPTGPLAEKLKGVTVTQFAKAPGYSEGGWMN